jgi:sec-independent protein translocase protein TatA
MIMGNFKGWEILIILALILLLFGAKRLPEAARGLGRSLRIFKSEMKEMHDDDTPAAAPRREDPVVPREIESQPRTTDPVSTHAPEPDARER